MATPIQPSTTREHESRNNSTEIQQQQPFVDDNLVEDHANDNQEVQDDYSPGRSEVNEESFVNLSGRLVDIMREYPCLWDTQLRSYKDINP